MKWERMQSGDGQGALPYCTARLRRVEHDHQLAHHGHHNRRRTLGTSTRCGPVLPSDSRHQPSREIVWRVLPRPISSADDDVDNR